jgi:hypothetical protein
MKKLDWADKAALRLTKTLERVLCSSKMSPTAFDDATDRALRAAYSRGAKAEREACAVIAGDCPSVPPCHHCMVAEEAIRDRGKP